MDQFSDPSKNLIMSLVAGAVGVFAGIRVHGQAIDGLQKSLDNHIKADSEWKKSMDEKVDRIIEREIGRGHGG